MLQRRLVGVSVGENSVKNVLLLLCLPCSGVNAQRLLGELRLPLSKDTSLVHIWGYLVVTVQFFVLFSFNTGSHSVAHAIPELMLTLWPLFPPVSYDS